MTKIGCGKKIGEWWNLYALTSGPFFEGELPNVQKLLDKFEEFVKNE